VPRLDARSDAVGADLDSATLGASDAPVLD
jgi:hypothetical protein